MSIETVAHIAENCSGREGLTRLVDFIRPIGREANPSARLAEVVAYFRGASDKRAELAASVQSLLAESELSHALATAGILSNEGLSWQLRNRLGSRVLPRVYPDKDLRSLIPLIFTHKEDWRWIRHIPVVEWSAAIGLLVPTVAQTSESSHVDIALTLLAQRIAGFGTDEEIHRKLDQGEVSSPFLRLPLELTRFLDDRQGHADPESSFAQVIKTAKACKAHIDELRDNNKVYGTSLQLNGATRRLLQKLQRFERLLFIAHPRDAQDFANTAAQLMIEVVEAEQTKNSLRQVVAENADLWAYQITEHTADKGDFSATRRGTSGACSRPWAVV